MSERFFSLFNLPNWLTLGRIAAVPVLIILLQFGGGGSVVSIVATVIFIIASLTDLLDGYLARRFQLVTNLGRFLDPLADKLLNSAALIMLIPLDRVPAWVVVLIIGREIAVTGLRSIAATEGIVIDASVLGKRKTLTQNIAIGFLLWHHPVWGLNVHQFGMILIYLALVITYWSGAIYFARFYKVFIEQSG
ncbi:MAG: CDP-diacylglycerol--glycerol-3-phosphate 3-phosphatidyltransferase [Proteobacteria bacterium]|nr:CDP-diacylglycerol--glycerol-3-phosphate 3-phosphatidyltransferase [Pseudomonadota bacterium]